MICDACKRGDHGYHSGASLAFICIGCPCEWTPDQSVCPQPCEHLSQHDAREGRTCPEHPCTCADQSIGGRDE